MGWQVFSVIQLFAGNTIINPVGMFVYFGPPATGNLSVSVVPGNATVADPESNTAQPGVTVYAFGGFPFTQLLSGMIQAQATAGQFAPAIIQTAGVAGELALTSGLATGADSAANVIIDSAVASGAAQSTVSLQAAVTQTTGNLTVSSNLTVSGTGTSLGGSTSTGAADNNSVTSGPSGTVSSFPAAGPNHTHAMAHHHPYHP